MAMDAAAADSTSTAALGGENAEDGGEDLEVDDSSYTSSYISQSSVASSHDTMIKVTTAPVVPPDVGFPAGEFDRGDQVSAWKEETWETVSQASSIPPSRARSPSRSSASSHPRFLEMAASLAGMTEEQVGIHLIGESVYKLQLEPLKAQGEAELVKPRCGGMRSVPRVQAQWAGALSSVFADTETAASVDIVF